MTTVLQPILEHRATLGEGPCWDAKQQLLYWVDIMENKVHLFDPLTGKDRSIDVGQMVGTVVPCDSGQLLICAKHGFYFLNPETEELTAIVDPESDLHENRFNDGKCDVKGRFWAGSMSTSTEDSFEKGSLYRLQPDLSIQAMVPNVTCSNGIAWSLDHTTMYFIDSPTKQVVAFDYEVESGDISNRRVVIQFPEGEGIPDGMTIDSEGMLWIAHWGGYQVSRWNPVSGVKIDAIKLPVAEVTSCTFGGPDLNELYITTAKVGLDEFEQFQQPFAGGLFRVKLEVKGTPTNFFKG